MLEPENRIVPANDDTSPNGLNAGCDLSPFISKLWEIVVSPATDNCIAWTPAGNSFMVTNVESFAKDVLPAYFKHANVRSFVRQLNTYGFRKQTNLSSDETLEFSNEHFRRNERELLLQIKRCAQPKSAKAEELDSPEDIHPLYSGEPLALGGPDAPPAELVAVRSRMGLLQERLGALQGEIREYNDSLDQKVNLLMQMLGQYSSSALVQQSTTGAPPALPPTVFGAHPAPANGGPVRPAPQQAAPRIMAPVAMATVAYASALPAGQLPPPVSLAPAEIAIMQSYGAATAPPMLQQAACPAMLAGGPPGGPPGGSSNFFQPPVASFGGLRPPVVTTTSCQGSMQTLTQRLQEREPAEEAAPAAKRCCAGPGTMAQLSEAVFK